MDAFHKAASATFDDLPICIRLKIFSYLDIHSILNAEHVSLAWQALSCDDVLWRKRLMADMRKWNVIGNNSNPLALQHFSSKDIYSRCSPTTRRLNTESLMHKFTKALRSMVVGRVPELVMVGPGLETGGVCLVRHLLQDSSKTFQCINMHPSQFGGVGSGVVLRLLNHHLDFVLITLYTAPKRLREARTATQRNVSHALASPSHHDNMHHHDTTHHQGGLSNHHNSLPPAASVSNDAASNIVSSEQPSMRNHSFPPNTPPSMHSPSSESSNSPISNTHLKLQRSIRHLLRTQHGLIYVIDSSTTLLELESGVPELQALCYQLLHPFPLLVLLCSQHQQPHSLTCVDVVRAMKLSTFTRPWQVHHCIVEGMLGVEKAFQWIVEASRH